MLNNERNPVDSRLAPMLAVAFAFVTVGVAPSKIADEFDAAVARLKAPFSGPGGSSTVAGIGLDPYRQEADALVKNYGPAAAGFLRSRFASQDPDTSRLALLTLALLASDPGAAAELTGVLRDSRFRDTRALMALTYAPAPVALALADEAFAHRDTQSGALAIAAPLFRFFGDARHAAALETELARPVPASAIRTEAVADLVALRQHLHRPVGERSAWLKQDLIVWRAVQSKPSTRSLDANVSMQAVAACALTRFTPAYLKDRLCASSIRSIEHRLILQIAILQPDASLIPELASIVDARRRPWGDAMYALLAIGTRDALAPVERLITPPKALTNRGPMGDLSSELIEESQREELVLMLCQDLARRGDRTTLDLMEKLTTNTAYPPRERAAFTQARNTLRERLRAKNP